MSENGETERRAVGEGALPAARGSSRAEQAQTRQRVLSAPRSVRYIGHEPRPSPEDEEEFIFEAVAVFRSREAEDRN